MTDHLFVTWSGGGNLPPALAIATELVRRGNSVRFMGHDDQRAAIEAAGFEFIRYASGRQWNGAVDTDILSLFRVFHDAGIAADVSEQLRSRPDVVVVDCLLVSALRSVLESGIASVVLSHTLFDYWLTWRRNPLTVLMGGRHGASILSQWNRADLNLVTALPELDNSSQSRSTDNRQWVGPVVPIEAAPSSGQAILVSLSTSRLPGQDAVLQRVVDAVADLGRPVIVTTGPAIDRHAIRFASGIDVHDFLPHPEAMRRASLVVGHGGHGTTMTALAHDLPLVMLPLHPMIDQPLVAGAVEHAGAGIRLKKAAAPAAITAAISEVLERATFRAHAAGLGAAIRSARASERAASAIESVRTATRG